MGEFSEFSFFFMENYISVIKIFKHDFKIPCWGNIIPGYEFQEFILLFRLRLDSVSQSFHLCLSLNVIKCRKYFMKKIA